MDKIFLIPIIVILVLGAGVFIWHYFEVPEERIVLEEEEIIEAPEEIMTVEECAK